MKKFTSAVSHASPTFLVSAISGLVACLCWLLIASAVPTENLNRQLPFAEFLSLEPQLLCAVFFGVLVFVSLRLMAYFRWWLEVTKNLPMSKRLTPFWVNGAFLGALFVSKIEVLQIWARIILGVVLLIIYAVGLKKVSCDNEREEAEQDGAGQAPTRPESK